MARSDVRQADLERVRAFNRLFAERIGALSNGFLGRGRPMGESRRDGHVLPAQRSAVPC